MASNIVFFTVSVDEILKKARGQFFAFHISKLARAVLSQMTVCVVPDLNDSELGDSVSIDSQLTTDLGDSGSIDS